MARGFGRFTRALKVSFISVLVVALSGCTVIGGGPQSVNNPAGDNMQKIWDLFVPIFWASVVVFVLVQGLLIVAVIRFRRREDRPAPHPTHGNTKLEIAWTIAPAIVLAIIAVPTLTTIAQFAKKPGPQALTVNVVGHQWWWEFDYPGQKVVVADVMHVPLGTTVEVNLHSADVIHSFWPAKLAGKQDVVPNLNNHLSFTATKIGTYTGSCAEFCGEEHANMRFEVVVDSQADFDTWVKQMQQPAVNTGLDQLAQQGQQVFFTAGCTGCHSIDGAEYNGQKAQGNVGPNLTHVGSRSIIAGGVLTQTEANIAKWVHNPGAVKPGTKMPDLGLTQAQANAVAHYLESLK